MKRAELKRKTPMPRGSSTLARTVMKKHAPKKRAGHDKPMLTACRGAPCYLSVPGICRGQHDTVVPCHANWPEYGKGAGLKARDEFTVPGCMHCHAWLDQGAAPSDIKRSVWESAFARWQPVRDTVKVAA